MNDTPLTGIELSALRAAGYELAGVDGDPDGTVYVVFSHGDQEVRSTPAEWRQVIAGLNKPPTGGTTCPDCDEETIEAFPDRWFITDRAWVPKEAHGGLIVEVKEAVTGRYCMYCEKLVSVAIVTRSALTRAEVRINYGT